MITENVEETDKTEGKHDVSTEAKQNGDEKTEKSMMQWRQTNIGKLKESVMH